MPETLTSTTFSTLLGEVLRGASLQTACECMALDVADVMDYVADDARMLTDLFSALIMRARTAEAGGFSAD